MAPGRPSECPFALATQEGPADTASAPAPARCPFSSAAAGSSRSTNKALDEGVLSSLAALPDHQADSSVAKCPYSGAVASQPNSAGTQKVPAEDLLGQPNQPMEQAPPAVCPYGFGSAKSASNPLHCPACKALYHDAVRLNCGHRLCQACVAPSPDCLLCGEDITSRESDAELQGHVDEFMNAAGVCERPGQAQEAAERAGGMDLRAAFWLQEGMRSLAGGNPEAALHRLKVCHAHLKVLVDEAGQAGPSAAQAVQLASVRGACGDCCDQLGQPGAAAGHYAASTAYLTACSKATDEVAEALAVSHGKLGDLHYKHEHLEPALDCYRATLRVRQHAISTAKHPSCDQQVGLATALVKLADLEVASGQAAAATATGLEARHALEQLASEPNLSEAVLGSAHVLEVVLDDILNRAANEL